jgi:ABC-2 type transport system ATP-binding protein
MKAEVMASLLHDPELIILDEPTIGLDVVTKNKIVKFLQQVEGKTLLYTSHDLEDVEKICSRILILDHGKLLTLDCNNKVTT